MRAGCQGHRAPRGEPELVLFVPASKPKNEMQSCVVLFCIGNFPLTERHCGCCHQSCAALRCCLLEHCVDEGVEVRKAAQSFALCSAAGYAPFRPFMCAWSGPGPGAWQRTCPFCSTISSTCLLQPGVHPGPAGSAWGGQASSAARSPAQRARSPRAALAIITPSQPVSTIRMLISSAVDRRCPARERGRHPHRRNDGRVDARVYICPGCGRGTALSIKCPPARRLWRIPRPP